MHNPKIKNTYAYAILAHILYIVGLLFFVANNEDYHYPASSSVTHRIAHSSNSIRTSSTLARVTAFSSIEFCATKYAQKTYPNCNGSTFPATSVAINSNWLKSGVKAVYIPDFDTTYTVIGRTDGNTSIDIWTGNDRAAALEIGNRTREINLIYN